MILGTGTSSCAGSSLPHRSPAGPCPVTTAATQEHGHRAQMLGLHHPSALLQTKTCLCHWAGTAHGISFLQQRNEQDAADTKRTLTQHQH